MTTESYKHFPFSGMEAQGLILAGSVPVHTAEVLSDGLFEPRPLPSAEHRIGAVLTILQMRDLKVRGLPGLRFHYPEALWNIAVLADGKPADLTVRAHTNLMMRLPLAVFDKYNTDVCRIRLSLDGIKGKAVIKHRSGRALAAEFTAAGPAQEEVPLIRTLYTRQKAGSFYHIPWGNTVPQQLLQAACTIQDRGLLDTIYGPSWKLETAYFFSNRPHYCAPSIPHATKRTDRN